MILRGGFLVGLLFVILFIAYSFRSKMTRWQMGILRVLSALCAAILLFILAASVVQTLLGRTAEGPIFTAAIIAGLVGFLFVWFRFPKPPSIPSGEGRPQAQSIGPVPVQGSTIVGGDITVAQPAVGPVPGVGPKMETLKQQSEAVGVGPPMSVFLCHSSGDKSLVRFLYQRLSSDGFSPWLDKEKLLPGQNWEFEIKSAIESAGAILVCLSRASVTKEGFLQREIKIVLDKADEKAEGTIFLIPVRLEECDLPDRLAKWQWVDLFEDTGYDRLVRALRARAGSGRQAAEQG